MGLPRRSIGQPLNSLAQLPRVVNSEARYKSKAATAAQRFMMHKCCTWRDEPDVLFRSELAAATVTARGQCGTHVRRVCPRFVRPAVGSPSFRMAPRPTVMWLGAHQSPVLTRCSSIGLRQPRMFHTVQSRHPSSLFCTAGEQPSHPGSIHPHARCHNPLASFRPLPWRFSGFAIADPRGVSLAVVILAHKMAVAGGTTRDSLEGESDPDRPRMP